jgi:hypothetical protein
VLPYGIELEGPLESLSFAVSEGLRADRGPEVVHQEVMPLRYVVEVGRFANVDERLLWRLYHPILNFNNAPGQT